LNTFLRVFLKKKNTPAARFYIVTIAGLSTWEYKADSGPRNPGKNMLDAMTMKERTTFRNVADFRNAFIYFRISPVGYETKECTMCVKMFTLIRIMVLEFVFQYLQFDLTGLLPN
jgi:hypothetical protein